MSLLGKIMTATGLSVYLKGQKPFTMPTGHRLFESFAQAVADKDVVQIESLINIASNVNKFMDGKAQIIDGEVFYGKEPVHSVVADYILDLINEGEDATFMLKFLENLMQNPSKTAREELFLFLQANNMPITEDGSFITYKWVKDDYWDCHTGNTNFHEVGKTYTMERSEVDDDRRVTCSTGLHVCSGGYTKFGDRLLLASVNPKDVVSVPYDYNNSKMRVAAYTITEEVDPSVYGDDFTNTVYRRSA